MLGQIITAEKINIMNRMILLMIINIFGIVSVIYPQDLYNDYVPAENIYVNNFSKFTSDPLLSQSISEDVYIDSKNSIYFYTNKHSESVFAKFVEVEINDSRDFEIELRCKVNGVYGALYWRNSFKFDKWNYFALNATYSKVSNYFTEIGEYNNGKYNVLFPWSETKIKKTNFVTLSIRIINSIQYFYINHECIYSKSQDMNPFRFIGFQCYPKVNLEIDYIKAFYLKKETYNYPPEILITEPDISRGFIVVPEKLIRVSGKANDNDGIYEVSANGIEASLQSGGYFSVDVPLAVGDNSITIKATDTKMKSSAKTFEINRKSENVVNNYNTNEKRVALIFGNSNYSDAAHLGVNPINDARDIASTLRTLGFMVIIKTDANLSTMNDAIREFGRQNRDADVALFYFAGHGMQVERENYLLPIGVSIKDKNDVDFECVSVTTVQKIMETSNDNRLNLIVLDACRNNPFRSWQRGGETGLADMTPPSGTLIAFATSPGSTASNGSGQNGLYTGELIKQIKKPQRIEDVFINTRVEVEKKTGGQQSPWELAKLRGKYFLVK